MNYLNARSVPVLLAVALLGAAAPARAAQRYTERSDRAVDVAGLRGLEVENSRGDVQVTASADGRLHVTAVKVCRGRDGAEARRRAGEIQVSAGPQGDHYVIRVSYPRRVDIQINFWELIFGHGDREDVGPSHELDLALEVPDKFDVQLESVIGDLTCRGISGRQKLSTTSGDCGVEAPGGAVEIRTVSGDVRLRGSVRALVRSTSGDITAAPGGPLDARTSSGDVEVEGAADSLVLATTSGDISVAGAPRGLAARSSSGAIAAREVGGLADLSTTSGGITVGLLAPIRGATISSSSGDVDIEVEPGADASFDLSTSSGDIECDVPVALMQHGKRSMIAKYGRGGAAVKAHTVSGDLHVTSGGR